ncbi:MAG: hypothetical protein JNJ80_08725 [Gemmatimonadetes bacterium]|nr:hypothetical protein [Gemmatimonadota bacterium]
MTRWLAAVLLLTACLDPDPDEPGGGPGSGVPELIPSRAWLEVGATTELRVDPVGPFGLRRDDPAVIDLAGATITALAPGTTGVEALFPTGRRRATITVVPAAATVTPALTDRALTDVSLLGIWSADAATSFAVGGGGTVLVTRDGGATWQRMNSGVTADLTAVWGASATDVYAVGARGTAIHYDGQNWEAIPLPTADALLEVWGLDRDHVYIVGASAAFRSVGPSWESMPGAAGAELWAIWGTAPDRLYASGQNGVILRWDGTTFRPMSTPTDYVLFGLWGTDPADVYAVGIRGTLLHYDGVAWTPVAIPSSADFFAIAGRSRTDIILVGNGGAVVSFNGTAWTQAPQTASFENLRAVQFDPSGTARVVGWAGTIIERGPGGWRRGLTAPILLGSALGDDGDLYAVGSSGALLRRRNGVLTAEGPVIRRDLYAITRMAGGGLVVVGDSGAIATRSGAGWRLEHADTRVLLRSVWAHPTDPDLVFAAGDRGTIIQRKGGTWQTHRTPTSVFIRHIFGLDGRNVYAVGDSGTVLRYEGSGWTRMPTPIVDRIRGIWGTGPDDLVAVGEKGVAMRYDGRRWYVLETGVTNLEIRALAGWSPTEIYAVGENGITLRFDGVRWRRLPPPTGAYLLGMAVAGNRLVAVGTNRTVLEFSR